MLSERTRSILTAGIRDFIATGRPITSERLFEDYDFGIKSAMIRSELHDLANSGFLCQPHSSSGRFPSDKAYKFFVSGIMEELAENSVNQMTGAARDILEYLKEGLRKNFVQELSSAIATLSVFYEPETENIHEAGLKDLFSNFDSLTKEDVVDIARDLEFLSERLNEERSWWEESPEWPQVFIGKSPITKSRHLSVIANRVSLSGDETFLIIGIGPKRTNYERSIKLFKAISNALNS